MANLKRDTALRYARAGLPVFPCVPGEKRPLVEHGLHDATTDPSVIRDWWSRWPDANVAMPTGHPGYDVVDIDVHPDGTGYQHLTDLRESGLLDGWTHVVRTPSGGLHVYFPGTGQRNGKVTSAHIDFRGSGGYVLVPPSVVHRDDGSVRPYSTISVNREQPHAVDWDAIRTHLAPAPPQDVRKIDRRTDAQPERVVQWLAGHVARAQEGNRNDALFWAACRAAEHGVSDPSPLRDAARSAGLTDREATLTIASAYRTTGRAGMHGMARPREPRSPSSPAPSM